MLTVKGEQRLIDADDLIAAIMDARRSETDTVIKLIRFIDKQPTIYRPIGRWIGNTCSHCRNKSSLKGNYCRFCGAEMEDIG